MRALFGVILLLSLASCSESIRRGKEPRFGNAVLAPQILLSPDLNPAPNDNISLECTGFKYFLNEENGIHLNFSLINHNAHPVYYLYESCYDLQLMLRFQPAKFEADPRFYCNASYLQISQLGAFDTISMKTDLRCLEGSSNLEHLGVILLTVDRYISPDILNKNSTPIDKILSKRVKPEQIIWTKVNFEKSPADYNPFAR